MKVFLVTLLFCWLVATTTGIAPPQASSGTQPSGSQPERIPVLIISGANNHDWKWTTPSLKTILEETGLFSVEVTHEPGKMLAHAKELEPYQVFVLDYNGPRWGEPAESNFLEAVRGGTGVAVIHAADNAFPGWVDYEKLVGHCWREGAGHGRFHEFDVAVVDHAHPITQNLPDLLAHPDELYHNLKHMHGADVRVLATALSSKESGGTGKHEPVVTVGHFGKGRMFHTMLGHAWSGDEASHASHANPQFRQLVALGTEWVATGDTTNGGAANQLTAAERAAGWKLLFDGNTSEAWRGFGREDFPQKGWSVEDGCLHVHPGGGGGDILTRNQYREFELQIEWKVSSGANSGIMYRVNEEVDSQAPWHTGPEYQILDDQAHPGTGPLHTAGALYGLVAAGDKASRPTGQFNHTRIVLRGNHVEHWLNHRLLLECEMNTETWDELVAKTKFGRFPGFGKHPLGHIDLQDHGNEVWFRNIKIRELTPEQEPANNPDQDIPLFNGKDLSGWVHHSQGGASLEDVWSVDQEQGILICKGSPTGYLRTKSDHKNFILHLEWRFSPITKKAGNSGVLFRMIGEDKVWPKSIEAQLQSQNAGDFWLIDGFSMKPDVSRTHGRNTRKTEFNERPVGEWNTYEILADRDRIELKVNGKVLNQAKEALVVPGKICLQSEGAEIHFRNIRLTELD